MIYTPVLQETTVQQNLNLILNFSQAHSQKQKHIAKAAKDIIIALLD